MTPLIPEGYRDRWPSDAPLVRPQKRPSVITAGILYLVAQAFVLGMLVESLPGWVRIALGVLAVAAVVAQGVYMERLRRDED